MHENDSYSTVNIMYKLYTSVDGYFEWSPSQIQYCSRYPDISPWTFPPLNVDQLYTTDIKAVITVMNPTSI